ncbi:MAG: GNAT family N-acetyltransferase [Pseudomonadota bacterium]
MADWKIRRATLRDYEALAACIHKAYAGYRKHIHDLPPVSAGIDDDIEANLVWVAERDRVVVGGLVLILQDDHAILANIGVDPDCSGMGIGRGLIERAESRCRKLGKRELRLSTHVAMPDNVRLYQHLGWTETARAGNKVYMTKHL